MKLSPLSTIVVVFMYCSCTTPTETKFDTATLNLKGSIKHITENTTAYPAKLDIEFKDNRIVSVKTEKPISEYSFEYDQQKLSYINHRGEHIKPEAFPLAQELTQPLFTYNPDSIVKNNHGDPIQIFSKNNTEVYRVTYTYDPFNNWIVRELYYDTNHVVLARAERTIVYAHAITRNDINTWNAQADSIFQQCKIKSAISVLIDTTINTKQQLQQIGAYVNKYYKDVMLADTNINALMARFKKTYGKENLSPELQKIHQKLYLLQGLTLAETFMYRDLSLLIPHLIGGAKNDRPEPAATRRALTNAWGQLSRIKYAEATYEEWSLPAK